MQVRTGTDWEKNDKNFYHSIGVIYWFIGQTFSIIVKAMLLKNNHGK